MKLQRNAASLRPGDMVTCAISSDENSILKVFIIGYYNTVYFNREVLSIKSSLFSALTKKGIFKDDNKEITLLEIDKKKYIGYALYQSVLDKLNRFILRLTRKK